VNRKSAGKKHELKIKPSISCTNYNNWQVTMDTFIAKTRVARWFVFKPKIQIWVNFGGPWIGQCLHILLPLVKFFGGILWTFGPFCIYLVHYFRFWYHGPRKIWQPWLKRLIRNTYSLILVALQGKESTKGSDLTLHQTLRWDKSMFLYNLQAWQGAGWGDKRVTLMSSFLSRTTKENLDCSHFKALQHEQVDLLHILGSPRVSLPCRGSRCRQGFR
jgi:hypothetical protein